MPAALKSLYAGLSEPKWRSETGPDADIVVSTRCRLARNLPAYPFPWRASERMRRETAQVMLEAVDSSEAFAQAARISHVALGESTIRQLVELRLCSTEWWHPGSARWLVVSVDGVRSLLINEEDHLRLQAILPGLQVESSLERAIEAEQ